MSAIAVDQMLTGSRPTDRPTDQSVVIVILEFTQARDERCVDELFDVCASWD